MKEYDLLLSCGHRVSVMLRESPKVGVEGVTCPTCGKQVAVSEVGCAGGGGNPPPPPGLPPDSQKNPEK
jgi:hypothetical protein